jgi:hypothetical protein
VRERTRDRDALHLAPRELARRAVGAIRETHGRKQLAKPKICGRSADAIERERQSDVPRHAEVWTTRETPGTRSPFDAA